MLEQQVPKLRTLLREGQVGVGETGDLLLWRSVSQGCGQALVQGIENTRLDVENHVIEVLEHVIDRAGRVADAPRNLAGRQAGKTVRLDNALRRIEYELSQLFGCVGGPTSHGALDVVKRC